MKKELTTLMPYLIILMLIFYGFPLLIQDTGSAMFILLLLIPILTFICAAVYGIKQGFSLLFSLSVIILFSPTILIFYNSSAWIYIIIYTVISLVGNGIGRLFYKKN